MTAPAPASVYRFVQEFTRLPGGRKREHGPYSGEDFLERVLEPRSGEGMHTVIDLTGVVGMASSFMDASFGEFANRHGAAAFRARFTIVASDRPRRVKEIDECVDRAGRGR